MLVVGIGEAGGDVVVDIPDMLTVLVAKPPPQLFEPLRHRAVGGRAGHEGVVLLGEGKQGLLTTTAPRELLGKSLYLLAVQLPPPLKPYLVL